MIQSQGSRQLFRPHALQQYAQNRARDSVIHSIEPRVITRWWILLFCLLLITLVTWSLRIPAYTSVPGLLLSPQKTTTRGTISQAVLFFPSSAVAQLSPGSSVRVQVSTGTDSFYLSGLLQHIDTQKLAAPELAQHYPLSADARATLPALSVSATVSLSRELAVQTYAGRSITARVQIGVQPLFSLVSIT